MDTLSTFVDNLRRESEQRQHGAVISECTRACEQLVSLHVNLLDIRARSLVACAQFDKALKDALQIQQLDIASSVGYLCQGYIHMEQGRWKAAKEAYKRGKWEVPDTDPGYADIINGIRASVQLGKKRVDIVSKLPDEISFSIIHMLYANNDSYHTAQCEYLMVCKRWRQLIIGSGHLQFHMGSPEDELNPIIASVSNYTKSLHFFLYNQPFYDVMEAPNQFKSLVTLDVKNTCLGNPQRMITALQSAGDTLTRLTLVHHLSPMSPDQGAPIRISAILKNCPHLKVLECEGNFNLKRLRDAYRGITELMIHPTVSHIDHGKMMEIMRRFPSLEILDVWSISDARPLTVIHEYCPSLRHLFFSVGPSLAQTLRHNLSRGQEEGLRTLSVQGINTQDALYHLASVIIHHHTTLGLLDLSLEADVTGAGAMTELLQENIHLQLPEMKRLQVQCQPDMLHRQEYLDMIAWIIQHSPNLSTVSLEGPTIEARVLSALAKCEHLSSFMIERPPGFTSTLPEDYYERMQDFFREHERYMDEHNRGGSRIEFISMQLDGPDFLLYGFIGCLRRLQTLTLYSDGDMNEDYGALFKVCSRLRRVVLLCRGSISRHVFYHLRFLQELEDLTISGDVNDAQAGLLSLQNCQNLKHLVCYSRDVDYNVKEALRSKIPDVFI